MFLLPLYLTVCRWALNNNYGVNKVPQVNILEMADAYKIELAAPGLSKEEFKIELKKNSL